MVMKSSKKYVVGKIEIRNYLSCSKKHKILTIKYSVIKLFSTVKPNFVQSLVKIKTITISEENVTFLHK